MHLSLAENNTYIILSYQSKRLCFPSVSEEPERRAGMPCVYTHILFTTSVRIHACVYTCTLCYDWFHRECHIPETRRIVKLRFIYIYICMYINMCIMYRLYTYTWRYACRHTHWSTRPSFVWGVSAHTRRVCRRTGTARVHTMYNVFAKYVYTCTRIFPLKQNPKTSTHTPPLACAGSYNMHPNSTQKSPHSHQTRQGCSLCQTLSLKVWHSEHTQTKTKTHNTHPNWVRGARWRAPDPKSYTHSKL